MAEFIVLQRIKPQIVRCFTDTATKGRAVTHLILLKDGHIRATGKLEALHKSSSEMRAIFSGGNENRHA